MAKQPTPQGISALLKNAGFKRSEAKKSSIKGLTDESEGFKVRKYRDDSVSVSYRPGMLFRGTQGQIREHEHLGKYTETIESAGFKVQQDQVGYALSLIVSANEEA
jgi:hypothetical protein